MRSPLQLAARWLSLAALLLVACGTTPPGTRSWADAEPQDTVACEDLGADQCVVFACDGEDEVCGVFDCDDVDSEAVAQALLAPGVELARFRPPMRGPGPFRNWRRLGLRQGASPRATFHFQYREGFLPAFPRYSGKVVKHHLLPQAKAFRKWFSRAGVDIHEYTIVIPEHLHQRIHRGDGRGGLWNQAWRNYIDAHPEPPPREAILRHAFTLVFRFNLTGPLIPYGHQVVPIGPQLFSK